jgi:hypothetical protein
VFSKTSREIPSLALSPRVQGRRSGGFVAPQDDSWQRANGGVNPPLQILPRPAKDSRNRRFQRSKSGNFCAFFHFFGPKCHSNVLQFLQISAFLPDILPYCHLFSYT